MKAKAAARFNGRQGGRFADEHAGTDRAEGIHHIRLAELRKGPTTDLHKGGTWPTASLAAHAAIADTAATRDEGITPSIREQRAAETIATAHAHGWTW